MCIRDSFIVVRLVVPVVFSCFEMFCDVHCCDLFLYWLFVSVILKYYFDLIIFLSVRGW